MEMHAVRKSASSPGLCLACERQGTCMYPRNPARPVMQCLEYEELSVAEPGGTAEPWGNGSGRLGIRLRVEPERLEPGLCSDCEMREGCTYPRLPGGVWFCDEFK
jgi:hypothetical protein